MTREPYVDEVYRMESRRVLATLIRLLRDFDLAEEALHEPFAAALEQWPARRRARESPGMARLGRPVQSDRCDPPTARYDAR